MNDCQYVLSEYKKEVEALWGDIQDALYELEKGMPKSYKRGMAILEKALAISQENIRILSYIKGDIESIKPTQTIEEKNDKDCFKWLRNSE